MAPPDDSPRHVDRTGIALVHEGERIFAPVAAAAELSLLGERVVNYWFPVEIEVVGAGSADAFAEAIYEALQRELQALG